MTRGTLAELIARYGIIEPTPCKVLGKETSYFFYGRAAYRPSDAKVIQHEYDAPHCFVFREILLGEADAVHAFDTGAHEKRSYDYMLTKDMRLDDFNLVGDINRPNKLAACIFGTISAYFEADRSKIPEGITQPWQHLPHAYVQLLKSSGRNEPDDRICSIEVAIHETVSLRSNLKAVIVPHTAWNEKTRATWLEDVAFQGAEIVPYRFVGGYPPEHCHTLVVDAVRNLYRDWQIPV
jgi:hypothetical protein